MLPVSFTGSYTENETNFPWQSNTILQKMISGVPDLNSSGFQGLLKIKKSSTFQGP